ncbi:MAG: cell division protein FtsZ [Alphaproteobacteria bacterium]|nr:cell division protein FtsZ [Alphaproteobacteria bacterium]
MPKKKRTVKKKKIKQVSQEDQELSQFQPAISIRVMGIGGSGKNMVNHMVRNEITGVDFIVANTDVQDLAQAKTKKKIHLGQRTTRGLGAGMQAHVGAEAATESLEEIINHLNNTDLLFIASGMGGGTGTGASPVIAQAARDMGILTVAVVTKPFSFEGKKRTEIAEKGIQELASRVDALIVIPNDNIIRTQKVKSSLADAFALSDNVLLHAVAGIADLITRPGEINIDYADIHNTIKNAGVALMGVGVGRGSQRVDNALQQAIASPLVETSIHGAKRILFSVASRSKKEILMDEVREIAERITEQATPNAQIIFGTTTDKNLKQGEIRVTVISTTADVTGNATAEPVAFTQRMKKEEAPEMNLNDDFLMDFSDSGIQVIQDNAPQSSEKKTKKDTKKIPTQDSNVDLFDNIVFGDDVFPTKKDDSNLDTWSLKDLWKNK